jgi:hypothetical protein
MIHFREVFHISRSGQAAIRDKLAIEVSCLSGSLDGTRPSRRKENASGQGIAFKFSKHTEIAKQQAGLEPPEELVH